VVFHASDAYAVVVRFSYKETSRVPLAELERDLETALEAAGVGIFDGDDLGGEPGIGCLYMYGPDGDAILDVIRPILESSAFLGDPSARLRSLSAADPSTDTRHLIDLSKTPLRTDI